MDIISKTRRSILMSKVKGRDTKPEMLVRRLVHSLGYRYRLHNGKLPGKPDMVFNKRKKVIFIHGCFWHLHKKCKNVRLPKSKRDFWLPKLRGNRHRDQKTLKALTKMGWSVLVIWECEITHQRELKRRVVKFLESGE